jgi:hypothetical protein
MYLRILVSQYSSGYGGEGYYDGHNDKKDKGLDN